MKVLHLIYTNGISGAEKHLLNVLPGLKLKGIECELLIICPPQFYGILNDFSKLFISKGITTSVIVSDNNVSLKTLKKVNKYLKDNGISIIHSHLVRSDIVAALIKQFFNKNLFLISTKHGYQEKVMCDYIKQDFKITKNLLYYVTLFVLKKTNANLAVSKYMADFFINLKLTKSAFPVIHHGVDIVPINSLRKKVQSFEIIMVGRLEVLKGHDFVIKAMPEILKHYPQTKLNILGIGSYAEQLKLLVASLNLQNNVVFQGFVHHPYPLISNADLIVIPSLAEAFGLVFIEAMALGTPIVAFDVPAGNEILLNEETGFLLPVGNVEYLAEKCIQLLKDADLRDEISTNAYNSYLKNFRIQTMVDKTASFLASLKIPTKI